MLGLIFQLIVLGLVFYLIYWLIGQIPLPEPVRVVILVLMALCLVYVLLNMIGFVGEPLPRLELRR